MAKLLTVSISVYQMVLNKLGDLATIPEQIRIEVKEVEGKIIVLPANLYTVLCFSGIKPANAKINANVYTTVEGKEYWFVSPTDYGCEDGTKSYLTITITDETV